MLQAAAYRALSKAGRSLNKAAQRPEASPLWTPLCQQLVVRSFIDFSAPFHQPTSKKFHENKVLPYTPEQVYDVVANVEEYKEFVPWCVRSVIISRPGPNQMEAELEVGFQMFTERYVSKVTLDPPHRIHSTVGDSTLFRYLDNHWAFAPGPRPGTATIDFRVEFEFKSSLYTHVANMFFNEVVARMMGALEGRCAELYGGAPARRRVRSVRAGGGVPGTAPASTQAR